jgi:hypothetical protein
MDNNIFHYLKILKADEQVNPPPAERQRTESTKREGLKRFKKTSVFKREPIDMEMDPVYKEKACRKLFYPNYLSLLGEESVCARMEHIVIKPLLFMKLRSILDSKYIDYRIYDTGAARFPEFCNSYLRNYEINPATKKPYVVTKSLSENEVKEINLEFIRYLMD